RGGSPMRTRQILASLSMAFVVSCGGAGRDGGGTAGRGGEGIQRGGGGNGGPAGGIGLEKWGAAGYGVCAAGLITPTVVLTAAHCIEGPIEGFYTGTGQPTELNPTPVAGVVRHEVTAWATHPTYDWAGGCPNKTLDVALVKLTAPLEGVTPIPI